MTFMPSFRLAARRNSPCTMARPPSPVKQTISRSGISSFAVMAAGSEYPMDDSPFDISTPFGAYVVQP